MKTSRRSGRKYRRATDPSVTWSDVQKARKTHGVSTMGICGKISPESIEAGIKKKAESQSDKNITAMILKAFNDGIRYAKLKLNGK